MNQKQLLFNRLRTAAFAAAMLFGTSAVFAQVKIGTNPTVINPANNLEVEASTTGRKTSVNKTTGQVTITDGTQGAGKVLTSDANGASSWQNALAGAMVNGTAGTEVAIPPTGNPSHTYSNASITFPRAGSYIVYAKWIMDNSDPTFNYNGSGNGYINTDLSTSTTTNTRTGEAAEWVYIVSGQQHSVPGFRVTVTAGQTMYFWFFSRHYTGTLRMIETYAVGPF
jgi:hypothetical protein